MECLPGMENIGKDDCITLNNCIYGLVQVTRQHCERSIKMLKKAGFGGGNVDSCLYLKKSEGCSIHSSLCR